MESPAIGFKVGTLESITIIQNLIDSGNWSNTDSQGRVEGENAVKLWLWAKSRDFDGSGKAEINLKEILKFFEISPRTYRRWLIAGVRLGFLREFTKVGKGLVRVYYSSPVKLATLLGVGSLGAIANVPLESIKNLRQTCTKIAALANQVASEYRQRSKKDCRPLLNPYEALNPSDTGTGVRMFATRRYLVVSHNVQLVGGSQKTAAAKRGRAEITVNRHLADLPGSQKKQIAVADPFNAILMTANKLQHKDQLGLFYLDGFKHPLKAHCCIYSFPDIELISKKNLRHKFKRVAKDTGLIRKTYEYKQRMEATCRGSAVDFKQ